MAPAHRPRRRISIHAPREGGDRRRPPAHPAKGHFNPRPPRGGRRHQHRQLHGITSISIHAPREGGDRRSRHVISTVVGISIHAPREGGDVAEGVSSVPTVEFQSTPPARGATVRVVPHGAQRLISIHAPREGGDCGCDRVLSGRHPISIHAPREGGDFRRPATGITLVYFNPRPPRGGRRACPAGRFPVLRISIHAPREGGDAVPLADVLDKVQFQSTPPARGATAKMHSFTRGSLTNK